MRGTVREGPMGRGAAKELREAAMQISGERMFKEEAATGAKTEWGARGGQGTAGAGRGVSDEREGPWAVSSVREPGPGGLAGHWVASGPGFG